MSDEDLREALRLEKARADSIEERFTAMVVRLREIAIASRVETDREAEKLRAERDEARAEVERLRAEKGRLKDTVSDTPSGLSDKEEQGVRDYLALRDVADRALSERDRATVERDASLRRAERAEALLIEERASRLAESLQEGP